MALSILNVKPHKVSRDLSGYITYIYGPAKAGKTTFATKAPNHLILAFEMGFNAIPGAMAVPILSWSDLRSVMRELKSKEAHDLYKTIIIDTIDIASTLCEKYVCSQNGVEQISQIPYGGGWSRVKKEFEEVFRTITQSGYALVFISHSKDKTFTRDDGTSYNQIVPTCPTTYNDIAKNMADLICYIDMQGGERKLVLRSLDNKVDVGCRFKDISPSIPFGYEELVKALNDAIDSEAASTNNAFVTNERTVTPILKDLDYNSLMQEFQDIVGELMQKDAALYKQKITDITTKILGRGKKFTECTPEQTELMDLIIREIKALD